MDHFEIEVDLEYGPAKLAIVQLDEYGDRSFARFDVALITAGLPLRSLIQVDTDCWMPPLYWTSASAEEYYEKWYYPNPVEWAFSDETVFNPTDILVIGKAICGHFCRKHLLEATTYNDDE